jgi:hypothetical protein
MVDLETGRHPNTAGKGTQGTVGPWQWRIRAKPNRDGRPWHGPCRSWTRQRQSTDTQEAGEDAGRRSCVVKRGVVFTGGDPKLRAARCQAAARDDSGLTGGRHGAEAVNGTPQEANPGALSVEETSIEAGIVSDEDRTAQPTQDFASYGSEGGGTSDVTRRDAMDVARPNIALGIEQGRPGVNLTTSLIETDQRDLDDPIHPR